MMNEALRKTAIRHLESILAAYRSALEQSSAISFDPHVSEATAYGLLARSQTAIEKITGLGSAYVLRMKDVLEVNAHESWKAQMLVGIVEALKDDLADGYLPSVAETIRAEVFDDILDMAGYLLSEGYKDAAAVIAGGALEAQLRQLCNKHGIDTQHSSPGKDPRPKSASRMNEDLGKGAYSAYDQKSITAWLDLRNSAAHGHYDQYGPEQVDRMIEGVRDFMARNRA